MSVFVWDQGEWDQAEWAGSPPSPEGWGKDWRWWWQGGGHPTQTYVDITDLVVEARWSTDAHTTGDGTLRGDLQPGLLTLRLWDPDRVLDHMDLTGGIWATYVPSGATWYWLFESLARGLYAPGDPGAADCVFTGSPWPSRLSSGRPGLSFPAQSVSARLTALASAMNSDSTLSLPAVGAAVAAQSQTATATAVDTSTGVYPSYLAQIRDAASPGVAWMAAQAATSPDVLGHYPGSLTLSYARWETARQRTLDRSQVVAGPPTTAGVDFLVTHLHWTAILGSSGAQSDIDLTSGLVSTWGYLGPGTMRLWGNVTATSGPEWQACYTTGTNVILDRDDLTEQYLSTISLQSGTRWTPAGKPATAQWDPYAHVFLPTDVAVLADDGGTPRYYRVVKSDHRLTSTVWQTTHYLEKFTAPTPLP